ncbi:uncharacterized protein LOC133190889 [Saccostrea echinata]|uniref:uncharacterized protein LOC133190889 n=1 Tax=Saccostrea echinata TaxID=191078 RepID=UPI002A7ED14E|nr:uncharacterized protein LOC133190889 [Saccostrea echinata]
MDAKVLSYHNKVQDWTQMYMLAADGQIYKNSKVVTYLPPQKLHQIENWRQNVRNNFRPKSSQFPRLNTPRANKRARSAIAGRTHNQVNDRKRIWSASSGRQPHFLYSDTNLDDVTHHLAETSLHYCGERALYQRNLLGKQLLKINTKQVQLINGENVATEAFDKIDKTHKQASNGLNSEGEAEHTSDNIEAVSDEGESETLSSISRMEGRGRLIHVNDQDMIQVRSQSNRLLNVISIDDCKISSPNIYHNAKLKVEKKRAQYQDIPEEESLPESDVPKSQCSKDHETNFYSTKSVSESRTQIQTRNAKISRAIDEMVHERKVMNNLDRNFDARIEATGVGGRIILDRAEGGATFKRLNNALKRHVNSVSAHRAHKQLSNWSRDGHSDQDLSSYSGSVLNMDKFEKSHKFSSKSQSMESVENS